MSSFAGYCPDCGKPVMHKTLFGTLHLCLTPEEKAVRLQMQAQRRANTSALSKLAKQNPIIKEAYKGGLNEQEGTHD
jgi:hypothetical protein